MQAYSHNTEYISDLEEIRKALNQLQKCEAVEIPFASKLTLWGMNEDEIHTRSHNPAKYYGIGHILPHCDMGKESAGLNLLRTLTREAELCATRSFGGADPLRICHILNRLNSALYVLTYKYLPEGYSRVISFHDERK